MTFWETFAIVCICLTEVQTFMVATEMKKQDNSTPFIVNWLFLHFLVFFVTTFFYGLGALVL